MKYKIEVRGRDSKKVEAVVGDLLNAYYAEKLLRQTKKVVNSKKYDIKIINAF